MQGNKSYRYEGHTLIALALTMLAVGLIGLTGCSGTDSNGGGGGTPDWGVAWQQVAGSWQLAPAGKDRLFRATPTMWVKPGTPLPAPGADADLSKLIPIDLKVGGVSVGWPVTIPGETSKPAGTVVTVVRLTGGDPITYTVAAPPG